MAETEDREYIRVRKKLGIFGVPGRVGFEAGEVVSVAEIGRQSADYLVGMERAEWISNAAAQAALKKEPADATGG